MHFLQEYYNPFNYHQQRSIDKMYSSEIAEGNTLMKFKLDNYINMCSVYWQLYSF